MTTSLVPLALIALLLALRATSSPSPHLLHTGQATTLPCDPSSFLLLLPPNATLEKVTSVPEGGSYGEGPSDPAYPWIPTNLPALCAVTVRVTTSPDSNYRFGLFLPSASQWKGRFLAVGNGGFAGGINWIDMAPGPHYGAASVSTSTGHNSSILTTSWALHSPPRRTDWGWRAMHGTILLAKALTSAYYHQPIRYSYYSGCSTGGRQGLREIQLSPSSFDGALIGAPAWWTTHLNNWITHAGMQNLPVDGEGHIPMGMVRLVADEVTRQCDGVDGVEDGIVSDPLGCKFDVGRLLCPPAPLFPLDPPEKKTCLSVAQVNTLGKIYGDWMWKDGQGIIYPGLTLSSEPQWDLLFGGDAPSPFGVGYARDFLFDDEAWDWRGFNESVVSFADREDPGEANAADVGAFKEYKERGGKLLLYHGLADGLVPTKGSLLYYNKTLEAFGRDLGAVREFFRVFLVPGMQHCWNSAEKVKAPWNFGGATQAGAMGMGQWSVPGFRDSRHDAMMALMDWVERGEPVERIVATSWNGLWNASSGVKRQRPLCAWPERAVWDGVGDVDEAGSWKCEEGGV